MPKDISDKMPDKISNKISENIFKHMLNKIPEKYIKYNIKKIINNKIYKYYNIQNKKQTLIYNENLILK